MDPLSLGMYAVVILMVVFMIRNSRKQKQAREDLAKSVVKGAQVMTTAGIFGKVVSVDDDANEIVIESTPGTVLRMHRQSVASIVDKSASAEKSEAATKSAAKKPAAKSTTK
jgi:preprotein translocase subunit YajC